MLPASNEGNRQWKDSKGAILKRTVDYVRYLQNNNERLRAGVWRGGHYGRRSTCFVAVAFAAQEISDVKRPSRLLRVGNACCGV